MLNKVHSGISSSTNTSISCCSSNNWNNNSCYISCRVCYQTDHIDAFLIDIPKIVNISFGRGTHGYILSHHKKHGAAKNYVAVISRRLAILPFFPPVSGQNTNRGSPVIIISGQYGAFCISLPLTGQREFIHAFIHLVTGDGEGYIHRNDDHRVTKEKSYNCKARRDFVCYFHYSRFSYYCCQLLLLPITTEQKKVQ